MVGQFAAAVVMASALGLGSAVAGPAVDPLAGAQWRMRVLLVFAGEASDPRLVRQRAIFAAMADGARDRDLKLIEAVGATPQADKLRARFDVDRAAFRAILIGKDGGDKLSSDEPLGADRLFPLIDAMPMRQSEMRHRS